MQLYEVCDVATGEPVAGPLSESEATLRCAELNGGSHERVHAVCPAAPPEPEASKPSDAGPVRTMHVRLADGSTVLVDGHEVDQRDGALWFYLTADTSARAHVAAFAPGEWRSWTIEVPGGQAWVRSREPSPGA